MRSSRALLAYMPVCASACDDRGLMIALGNPAWIVASWLAWFALAGLVIARDLRTRRARQIATDMTDTSIRPWLLLIVCFAPLTLPFYFRSTRESGGLALGFAWLAACFAGLFAATLATLLVVSALV